MAKRPSVSEIIAAVRAAGPASPESEAEPVEPSPAAVEPEPEPAPPPVEAPVAAAPTPTAPAPSPGRPLSLKEKLAAAKNRPAGNEPAAPAHAAPAPPQPAAQAEEVSADEPAPGTPAAPAPAPTGRPLTLKEKLAAAKSRPPGAAPAGASPGTKPAAAKAAPAAKAAARPANRALPPLEQMSDPRDLAEALRRTAAERAPKAAEPAAKAAPAKKPTPSKAVPPRPTREVAAARTTTAAATEPESVDVYRRGFLAGVLTSATAWMVLGWATLGAGLTALVTMCGRFMFPNVLAEPPSSIKVGLPTAYEPDAVNEDFKAEWGFWIVRSSTYDGVDKIYAIQSVCTHLGCPPNWLPSEQKFKCPCHGSGFYISGVNFEGPAPRPLERFRVVMADDGQILVDKSQKFQEELGQWTDPDSYIPV